MAAQSGKIPATLIPGDGIGPEITDAVVAILDALGAPFDWDSQQGGMAAIAGRRRSAAARAARQHPAHPARAQGPAGHAGRRRLPLGERAPARGVPALRQPAPGAHAHSRRPLRQHRPRAGAREPRRPLRRLRALHPDRRRPARGRRSPRASTRAPARGASRSSRSTTRSKHGRKKVTHRAQGEHPEGADRHLPRDRAARWRRSTTAESQVDDRIVDACAMQLVLNPWQFDVIVTTNLFGDILSDEIAGLVGGLGMAPGAQHRRGRGDLRGGARLRARHRRQGHRQPDRAAARRGDDARARREGRSRRARLRAAIDGRCARTTCAPATSAARPPPGN